MTYEEIIKSKCPECSSDVKRSLTTSQLLGVEFDCGTTYYEAIKKTDDFIAQVDRSFACLHTSKETL